MIIRGEELSSALSEGVVLDDRERLVLAQSGEGQTFQSYGAHTVSLELPAATDGVAVLPLSLDVPKSEESPRKWSHWPVAVCDVIVQTRFLLVDGSWSPWRPRNLLAGGGFEDKDGNGIPDGVTVMRLRSNGSELFVGTQTGPTPCPTNSWWREQTVLHSGSLVDTSELPPGVPAGLLLERDTSDGQDTAEMRRDLVPPGATLTVSGWNRYDIGTETSMGVMARFHEFDETGRRTGKYVLLGDDDFHQPSGTVPWRWRALTFTTMPDTVRLGTYPVRMIRAQGRAWAAGWEIRESSVFSPWGDGRIVFRDEFRDPEAWETDPPEAARFEAESGQGTVVVSPAPGTVATLRQRVPFPLREKVLYAFRIDLGNRTSPAYDPTHDTWVSCYLEFRNGAGEVLDTVKAMAFRPDPAHPVGAAAFAPPGTRQGTLLLAASHKTYADSSRITGTMTATFRRLQVEESPYDPVWTPRPPDHALQEIIPEGARRMQVRARLMTRDPAISPSFSGYEIRFE